MQQSNHRKGIEKNGKMAQLSFPGGGVLDFGLHGGVPPGPRDPNPCLEVKTVPMFRDFAQKMDPENFCDFDEKLTHV